MCGKHTALCVCAEIRPLELKTRVLILQHPQELDRELGTAKILLAALPSAKLRVGLSARNLSHALGEVVDAGRWGVLFLGGKQESRAKLATNNEPVQLYSRSGAPLAISPTVLDGIVVLDGNWRQAKAMWWRNPWLLKLNRIVLKPERASLYGNLRREPRRESLSTLESVALALAALEGRSEIEADLLHPFQELLNRARSALK